MARGRAHGRCRGVSGHQRRGWRLHPDRAQRRLDPELPLPELDRPHLPWRRRPLWTIAVSVRTTGGHGARLQEAGTTAAWEHQVAWDGVQKWIDGAGTLAPTLDNALAALD